MTSRFPASLRVIGRSIVDWWDAWLDMVLMTLVWFFAQFTVILGPPATFGVYYVVHNMLNGEALGLRGMFSGARKYFGKSLIWGLLNLFVIFMVALNVQFYGNIPAVWGFYLQIFIVMLAAVWITTQFYALPYFMEQDVKNLRIAFKNGLFTSLAAPLFSLIMLIFIILVLVLSFGLMIPLFLGLPSLLAVLGFRAMYNRLEKFGLREPEKTPRELEMEESEKVNRPSPLKRDKTKNPASPGTEYSFGEEKIQKKE